MLFMPYFKVLTESQSREKNLRLKNTVVCPYSDQTSEINEISLSV